MDYKIYKTEINAKKNYSEQIFYSNTSSAAFILLSQIFQDK